MDFPRGAGAESVPGDAQLAVMLQEPLPTIKPVLLFQKVQEHVPQTHTSCLHLKWNAENLTGSRFYMLLCQVSPVRRNCVHLDVEQIPFNMKCYFYVNGEKKKKNLGWQIGSFRMQRLR